eukprot:gene2913-3498_t
MSQHPGHGVLSQLHSFLESQPLADRADWVAAIKAIAAEVETADGEAVAFIESAPSNTTPLSYGLGKTSCDHSRPSPPPNASKNPGLSPQETTHQPASGQFVECRPETTLPCDVCLSTPSGYAIQLGGGRSVKPLDFMSHSLSDSKAAFLCRRMLPAGCKTLVDVGSRTGVVVWSACAYTDVAAVIGIEGNSYFAQLQKAVIEKSCPCPDPAVPACSGHQTSRQPRRHNLGSRARVFEGDALSPEGLQRAGCTEDHLPAQQILASADCVVMNNVFEWFTPHEGRQEDVQVPHWQAVRRAVSRPVPTQRRVQFLLRYADLCTCVWLATCAYAGVVIIATPSLEEVYETNPSLGSIFAGWVTECPVDPAHSARTHIQLAGLEGTVDAEQGFDEEALESVRDLH